MRDMGGVTCTAVLISVFAVSLLTYNKLENELVAQLYKRPKMWPGAKDAIKVLPKLLNANS